MNREARRAALPTFEVGSRLFVSELPRRLPTEGAQVLAAQIEQHLNNRHGYVSFGSEPDNCVGALTGRFFGSNARKTMRGSRPVESLIYMPASGLTLATILRSLLLSILLRPKHSVLIVTQIHVRPKLHFLLRLLAFMGWDGLVANDAQKDLLKGAFRACRVLAPRLSPDKVSTVDRVEARRQLALPQERPIFLHVGHARRGRNLHFLAPLAAQGLLVLVLSQAFEDQEGAVPQHENIRLVRDYVPDMGLYYRASDVYVFPVQESNSVIGLPMSVAEALANQLPVAALESPMVRRWQGVQGVHLVSDPRKLPATALRACGTSVPNGLIAVGDRCADDLPPCTMEPS